MPVNTPPLTTYRKAINVLKRNRAALVLSKALNPGRRVEIQALMEHLQPGPVDKLLDIGCGDGYWTNYFGKRASGIIGIDPYHYDVAMALQYAHPHASFCLATSEFLPFPESSFTKAVSVCVFEHLYDDKQALQEVYRVLVPGGILAATVDSLNSPHVSDSHRQWHMESAYCQQLYNAESIKERFLQAGFRDIHTRYLMGSPIAVAWEILTERVGAGSMFLGPFVLPLIKFFERPDFVSGYKLLVFARKGE